MFGGLDNIRRFVKRSLKDITEKVVKAISLLRQGLKPICPSK